MIVGENPCGRQSFTYLDSLRQATSDIKKTIKISHERRTEEAGELLPAACRTVQPLMVVMGICSLLLGIFSC